MTWEEGVGAWRCNSLGVGFNMTITSIRILLILITTIIITLAFLPKLRRRDVLVLKGRGGDKRREERREEMFGFHVRYVGRKSLALYLVYLGFH